MSKSISKNTLNLRFMQNAMRAKQQAEVELEQAKIKDEAEWEVPQEVKDAWGIGASSAAESSSVTHEASYLPFLFDSDTAGESSHRTRAKGRRTFNARGQEVSAEVAKEEPATAPPADEDLRDDNKPARRLTAISGFKAPLPTKKKDSKRGSTKTAQELIREDVRRRPASVPQPSPTQTGFLRPSGVDMPASSRANAVSASASSSARADGGPSLKRDREPESAGSASRGADGKKRKKHPISKNTETRQID